MKINPNIEQLIPYTSKLVNTTIRLNANETTNYLFPNGYQLQYDMERYPVATPQLLTTEIASKYNVSPANIILGNGSTELLELSVKTFTEAGDTILSIDPSFSMYDVYSQMYGCSIQKVSINQSVENIFKELMELDITTNPSVIFICNPNNPTGDLFPKELIIELITQSNALVIVDEAYMEFAAEQESLMQEILTFPNALIARTFSKAYGLASLRLGYMIANNRIITTLSKAKLPYSINEITARIGVEAIQKQAEVSAFINASINERDRVYQSLQKIGLNLSPTYTNFFYVTSDIDLQKELLAYNILIRSLSNNTYRITLGNPQENDALIQALQEVL